MYTKEKHLKSHEALKLSESHQILERFVIKPEEKLWKAFENTGKPNGKALNSFQQVNLLENRNFLRLGSEKFRETAGYVKFRFDISHNFRSAGKNYTPPKEFVNPIFPPADDRDRYSSIHQPFNK